MKRSRGRVVGLLLGFVADRLLGDPRRWHPVAGFGSAASAVEHRIYGDSRARGVGYAGLLVGGTVLTGVTADRADRSDVARTLLTALAAWVALGGRSLEREAHAIAGLLDAGDLQAARERLRHLVGRNTDNLSSAQIARAVIESVAENTSDAVVAPLFWGGLAGVPGLLGYRATNTLDAMVGHHGPRYQHFGWAAARLDDAANLPASRISGLLTLAAEPTRVDEAWRTWRLDAAGHPSPNAGVVEATFAGSLGVRLGGTNTYPGSGSEHRVVMGPGRAPDVSDIPRATRLARRIGVGAAIMAAAVAMTPHLVLRILRRVCTGCRSRDHGWYPGIGSGSPPAGQF